LFFEKNWQNFLEFRTLMIWIHGLKNKLHTSLTNQKVH
jgi:hypothetical protein